MSDEDKESKTEAATGGRLGKAYKEGQVVLSRDVVALASMGAASLTLASLARPILDSFVQLFRTAFDRLANGRPLELGASMARPATLMLAVVGASAAGTILATMVQTRGGFWTDRLTPNLGRVFSGLKLMNMFRGQTLTDMATSLVKSVAVGWVIWASLRAEIMTLPRMFQLGPDGLLTAMYGPLGKTLVKLLTTLTILAGADFALTRYRFFERLKMTKAEVKREQRDDEGDPLIKSRRRKKHRELIKGRAMIEVPRADVVVVNPTHIAIVLRYRSGEDAAPRVTAKGKGEHAEYIRSLAREHGIPIVENIALARLLFRRVKVGRSVPAETFKTVAAILAFVYRTIGRPTAQEVRP